MRYHTILLEKKADVDIIHVLERRIFLQAAEKFHTEITLALQQVGSKVIVDLGKVHVVNSSGLGVLIQMREQMLKRKGKMAICSLQPVMKEIFERMHLDGFFTITASKEEALAFLRER